MLKERAEGGGLWKFSSNFDESKGDLWSVVVTPIGSRIDFWLQVVVVE